MAYVLAFIGHVLIARVLSPSDFGLVALAVSTLSLVNFSDLGISQSLTRVVSELRAKGLDRKISGVVLTAFKIRILTGVSLGALVFALSGAISTLVLSKPQASAILQILALGIFVISSFGALAAPVLLATRHFGRSAAIDFLSSSADSIFTMGLVLLGFGVIGYAFGVLSATILAAVIGLMLLRVSWRDVTGGGSSDPPNQSGERPARVLLSLGLPIATGSLLFTAYSSFVPFAVGALRRLDDVAFYSIPFGLTYVLVTLLASPLPVILPVMTSQYVKDPSTLSVHYTTLLRYFLLATIPISMVGFIFARYIVEVLYTPAYLPAVIGLQILVLSIVPRNLNYFLGLVFQTVRKNRAIAVANLVGLVLCVPSALILVSGFSYVGGAFAFLSATVVTTIVLALAANRSSLILFKKTHVLKPFTAAASMLPIYFLGPTGRLWTPIMLAVAIVLYISTLSIIGGVDLPDLDRLNRFAGEISILRPVIKATTFYSTLVIRGKERLAALWREAQG